MRSMGQVLLKNLTVTSRGSHGYGLKSRDTVEIALAPSKMAAPTGQTLNQFYKVIFVQKVFFMKTRNNQSFLIS